MESSSSAGLVTRDGPQIEEVVDRLGFGSFQFWSVTLILGIWIMDGMDLALTSLLTKFIAADLGIPDAQRATLVSMVYVGMCIGCGIGGYIADFYGRRFGMLLSYTCAFVAVLLSLFVTNFMVFCATRLLLGTAMGVGLPGCFALLNESVPSSWRPAIFAVRGVFAAAGHLTAIGLVIIDDPRLETLHWRRVVTWNLLITGTLMVVSFMFLYESPLWLAHTGRPHEALRILEVIRHLNRAFDVDPSFVPPVVGSLDKSLKTEDETSEVGWQRQLGIVFGREHGYDTVVLIVVAFVIHLANDGIAYAEPFVLTESDPTLAAGYQLFIKDLVSLPVRLFVISLVVLMGNKTSLISGMLLISAGALIFTWGGSVDDRGFVAAASYYLSQYLPMVGVSLGQALFYQLSVDIYPTVAAGTGAGVVVIGGRAGSISAPFVYEMLPYWQHFYCVASAACALAAAFVPPATFVSYSAGHAGSRAAALPARRDDDEKALLQDGDRRAPSFGTV